MMMTKLQTLMTSLRQCFTLHHQHRRRRHRPCQTMLSTVVDTVRLAHRLSAYRLPVLARGRPRFVVVPSSDIVIYAFVIIYVSFRLFSCLWVIIYVWDMLHVCVTIALASIWSGDIYLPMYARDILLLIRIVIPVTFPKRLQQIIKIQVHLN